MDSAQLLANTQPSLSSLTVTGGKFSGSLSGSGTVTVQACAVLGLNLNGSISGTVSPGGSVSWSYTITAAATLGNPDTLTGSGSGTTSMLVANGTFFDSIQDSNLFRTASFSRRRGPSPRCLQSRCPVAAEHRRSRCREGPSGRPTRRTFPPPAARGLTRGRSRAAHLPAGLTLASDGFLSGTPTQAGGSFFTATVTDSTGAFCFFVICARRSRRSRSAITTTSLPNGIAGTPYPAQVLTASGGTPPYTFQITGTLPAGL